MATDGYGNGWVTDVTDGVWQRMGNGCNGWLFPKFLIADVKSDAWVWRCHRTVGWIVPMVNPNKPQYIIKK